MKKLTTSPFELDPKLIRFVCRVVVSGGMHPNVKGPALLPGLFLLLCSERSDLEIHTTHAAYAAATRRHATA
jgi:hypothetical protein